MVAKSIAALLAISSIALVACGDDSPAQSSTTAAAGAQPQRVAVPDVVGQTFGDAKRTLARAGLEHTTTGFPGTLGSRGYDAKCTAVSSEAPPGGTRVIEGSEVAIVYGVCRKEIVSADNGH